MAPSADKIVQLKPEAILADHNTRYGLLDSAVENLMASILSEGGVQEPISVIKMDTDDEGHTHKLLKGFYRHEAITRLNKDGAGLTLPTIVREEPDSEMAALRLQVTENVVRKNQSPMDTAIAIRMLLDAGMPRLEVRTLYARPSGGKKSILGPASNAWINMHLSFLDFPKAIQKKIHEGGVGVAAAYELTRVSPDKREAVLEKAENERERELDLEAKAEAKLLKEESKVAETRAKEEQAEAELKAAQLEAETAATLLDAATLAYKTIGETPGFLTMKDEDKRKLTESLKATQADIKGAEKAKAAADKKLGKLQPVSEAASTAAEKAKKTLATARQAKAGTTGKHGAAKKPAVGPGNVKKAAKEAGEASGVVPLSLADIRSMAKELATPGGFPKVQAIGTAFKDCIDGKSTPKELYRALGAITGELPASKVKK